MISAPIAVATATIGNNVILAAPTDTARFYRIHAISLFVGAATNITIQGGATPVTGAYPLTATLPLVLSISNQDGLIDLPAGQSFNLVASAAVSLQGHVSYSVH